jgi:hypothetical protein
MKYDVYYPDYLSHAGIKGMKWGVRRYQNKDGTLTPKGKKRYSNREITKEKNQFYDKTYKELYNKYEKTNRPVAADRAHAQAKKLNAKHLVDTYGKERMDKYYESERKKLIAAGNFLVGSMAALSVVALVGNKIG